MGYVFGVVFFAAAGLLFGMEAVTCGPVTNRDLGSDFRAPRRRLVFRSLIVSGLSFTAGVASLGILGVLLRALSLGFLFGNPPAWLLLLSLAASIAGTLTGMRRKHKQIASSPQRLLKAVEEFRHSIDNYLDSYFDAGSSPPDRSRLLQDECALGLLRTSDIDIRKAPPRDLIEALRGAIHQRLDIAAEERGATDRLLSVYDEAARLWGFARRLILVPQARK
jgi:hypothetical protein